MRTVSKTVNSGSNPGSPASEAFLAAADSRASARTATIESLRISRVSRLGRALASRSSHPAAISDRRPERGCGPGEEAADHAPAADSVRRAAVAAVAGPFGRDVSEGLARVASTVAAGRARGAQLVVFPESALGGYLYEPKTAGAYDAGPPVALAPDGDEIRRLVEIAGPTTLCVGYTEATPDGPASSAVCVSGDGVLGRHRKVHLPPGERGIFVAGDGFAAFDTPVGRVGMLICYEKTFPEAARRLSLDGAQIVASLSAWPVCRRRPSVRVAHDRQVQHFNVLDRARAIENQVVWVSANQCGRFGRLRFPGQAKVVDPDGRVVASTGSRAGTALARIDVPDVIGRLRSELSHLGDRRPEAYVAAA